MSRGKRIEVEEVVATAARAWASTIFGAPARFDELITRVEIHDEVIRRVVSKISRRELRIALAPSTEQSTTAPKADLSRIDPFVHTLESLRAVSIHTVVCNACKALGQVQCSECRATGIVNCPTCNGSGKQRSEKTNRLINCKTCKKRGTVGCSGCGTSGYIRCQTCTGSGHLSAWLQFEVSERWALSLTQSEATGAFPVMRQERPLSAQEVVHFDVLASVEADGAVAPQLAAEERSLSHASFEPTNERVTYQQFLKLAIPRRDVTYELCGSEGVLILSGKNLLGAPSSSRWPIRKRLVLWLAATIVLLFVLAGVQDVLLGRSEYFRFFRQVTSSLLFAVVALAIPTIGGALRRARDPEGKALRATEKISGAAAAFAALAMVGLASFGRPSVAQVDSALIESQPKRAREVLTAFRELHGESSKVAETDDAVMMLEASRAPLEEALTLLGSVEARGGPRASAARLAAEQRREAELKRLLLEQNSVGALELANRWYPRGDIPTPAVAGLVALAHDQRAERCSDNVCKLVAYRHAQAVESTPVRIRNVELARAQLELSLTDREHGSAQLEHLQNMRKLHNLAEATLRSTSSDDPLHDRAVAAAEYSGAERTVALIGAGRPVVHELLEEVVDRDRLVSTLKLGGADAYLRFDEEGVCRGMYVVGSVAMNRAFDPAEANRALLLATGVPAAVHVPATDHSDVRWKTAQVPILARWHAQQLWELRVGDADP